MNRLYKIGKWLIITTTAFWLTYTIVYLFIDGWHFEAVSESEKDLDKLSSLLFNIGFTAWGISVAMFIDKLFEQQKDKK